MLREVEVSLRAVPNSMCDQNDVRNVREDLNVIEIEDTCI